MCIRHDRDTNWPINEPEDWISKHATPIRHQIDEVPPYNYTGIDEQISNVGLDESAGTFYFDENCDKVDATHEVIYIFLIILVSIYF